MYTALLCLTFWEPRTGMSDLIQSWAGRSRNASAVVPVPSKGCQSNLQHPPISVIIILNIQLWGWVNTYFCHDKGITIHLPTIFG